MKKLVSFLFAILLISVTLTGCGLFGQDDPVAENEIVIARWSSALEEDQFRAWGDKFIEANPDVKIKWEFLPYLSHFDKASSYIRDEKIDILCLNNWAWYGYQESNVFVDLNIVDALSDSINALIPKAKEAFVTSDGRRIGVSNGSVIRRPIVNAGDFTKANVTIPNKTSSFTPNELLELLEPVVNHEDVYVNLGGGKTDYKMGINFDIVELMYLLASSAGAPIYDYATKKTGVDNPAGWAAMAELKDFCDSGYQVPYGQSANGAYGTPASAMTTGTCITSYSGTFSYQLYESVGIDFKAIPTIKATGGTDTSLVEYNNFCVLKSSTKKDYVYRFINWALSEQGQIEFAKFSDLPTNLAAYNYVTSNWEQDKYAAYGVGSNNIYVYPSLSSEFNSALSTAMNGLFNSTASSLNAAKDFCAAIKAAEKYL